MINVAINRPPVPPTPPEYPKLMENIHWPLIVLMKTHRRGVPVWIGQFENRRYSKWVIGEEQAFDLEGFKDFKGELTLRNEVA